MKQIYVLLIAGVFLTGCKDFLDIQPVTQKVEDNFYKTQQDGFDALTAVYDAYQVQGRSSTFRDSPYLAGEMMADECFGGGGAGDVDRRRADRFQMVGNDGSGIWKTCFETIYRANQLLSKIDGIEFETDSIKNKVIGEAKFMRALAYFDVIRFYEDVPLMTQPVRLADASNVKQASPQKVYAQIANDLLDAAVKMSPMTYQQMPVEEFGHATRWAAKSLLARVYLYYTGYYKAADLAGVASKQTVATHIDDVINNSGHTLISDFASLWPVSGKGNAPTFAGENNVEVIWAIKYTGGGAVSSSSPFGQWDGNWFVTNLGIRQAKKHDIHFKGWGQCTVNPIMWNAFGSGDSRKEASIISIDTLEKYDNNFTYAAGEQHTGLFIKKYTPLVGDVGSPSWILNFGYDFTVIRFADVLLMAAELHDYDATAQGYYNRVRNRAFGLGDVSTTTAAVKTVNEANIREERKLELAFENIRYWDLLRYGLDVAEAAIDNLTNDEFHVDFRKETKGLIPIPQSELDLTDFQQNASKN